MSYTNINDQISNKLFLYRNGQKYTWELIPQPVSNDIIIQYDCFFLNKQKFNYKEIHNIFFNQTVCDYSSVVKVFDIEKPKNHNNNFNWNFKNVTTCIEF
jgi:hypothetical protein